MDDKLFEGFSQISDSTWMDRIIKDLKGKIPEEKLYSQSQEEIELKPFYSGESVIQGIEEKLPLKWSSLVQFDLLEESVEHLTAQKELFDGIQGLLLRFDKLDVLNSFLKKIEGQNLDIHLEYIGNEAIPVHGIIIHDGLQVKSFSMPLFPHLLSDVSNESFSKEGFMLHLENREKEGGLRSILIEGKKYKSAGANASQEVACILSELNEYIEFLKLRNQDVKGLANKITVKLACGTDYYMEIAKMRSIRLLMANLFKAQGIELNQVLLICQSSDDVNSIKDPYTNILRRTTSNMSAIIGGCDALIATPFMDEEIEFSTRISKNIQLILKHESHLDKVANPASGSYFFEKLTRDLSKNAWSYFKELESQGGFEEGVKGGRIQKDIAASAKIKMDKYKDGSKTLIGVNKYANPHPPEHGKSSNPNKGKVNALDLQIVNYAQEIESENQ